LIADGATASNYQQMGMAIGVAPEEWIFDQPENVLGLLACEAASTSPPVLVAGSMGPTGMLMEPFGELTPARAADAYAEQAAGLSEGGADVLLLETFFALDEALAAIEGVRRASGLPLVVSFSFDRGTRTMMGLRPTRVIESMAPLGVGFDREFSTVTSRYGFF
jgi:5-methyltetrahydrofolate--homocysteine methyltransferase